MPIPTHCEYCVAELPAPHVGRGKQKSFCNQRCRALWWYRKANPKRVTKRQRRLAVHGEFRAVRLQETEKAWLAAMFDGEGYIGFLRAKKNETSRYHYFAMLAIFNTDRRLVDHAGSLLGPRANVAIRRKKTIDGCKELYEVKVKRGAMAPILEAIMPYLIAKRRQAEIVIAWSYMSDDLPLRAPAPPEYDAWYTEMKTLNRRGLEE